MPTHSGMNEERTSNVLDGVAIEAQVGRGVLVELAAAFLQSISTT